MDQLLSIGAFARRSRLSTKALRLYDRLGLLKPATVDSQNGYRWYHETQLETARLVGMLRRLELPLATITDIIVAPSGHAADLLAAHWAEVERRHLGHRELHEHLERRMRGVAPDTAAVRIREVSEQLVLTEQRHTTVDDLSCWLGAAFGRLGKTAAGLGGPVGHPFVVYYGEVSEDGDGPVEVCFPVNEHRRELPMRREPAHREAFVRIKRSQVEFPQILSAYDQVAQWVEEHRMEPGGAPREVYLADFSSAAPDDEICDIAFPIGQCAPGSVPSSK